MSVYSEAWHNLSPRTRDFYVNFQRVRMNQTWHESYNYDWDFWNHFTMFGWSFSSYFGYAIAYRNWSCQTQATGSFNPEIIMWSREENFWTPHPTPITSYITGYGNYHNEFKDIPDFAFEYPRAKYKVRRSYWTGKPRRRRNL